MICQKLDRKQVIHFIGKIHLRYSFGLDLCCHYSTVHTVPNIDSQGAQKCQDGSQEGQVEWSSEHRGLHEDVQVHGREFGTKCSLRSLLTQAIPWFHENQMFLRDHKYLVGCCQNSLLLWVQEMGRSPLAFILTSYQK